MTELETQIDREVGNDTEHERQLFLKYINFGKALQREASNTVTVEEAEAAKAVAVVKGQSDLMAEIDAIMKAAGAKASEVERVDEKQALRVMTTIDGKVSMEDVMALIADVDAKHSAIIHERNAALEVIRARLAKASE